jgi:cysteine desulfurase
MTLKSNNPETMVLLRKRFWQGLQEQFGDRVALKGHSVHRLPNTLNVSFVGRVGAEIVGQLEGWAASTGSACHSGRIELCTRHFRAAPSYMNVNGLWPPR